jgi:hypothetical protein
MVGAEKKASVRLFLDSADSYHSLYTWLNRTRGVRVELLSKPPRCGEQGAAIECISVALGSGGIGMALAQTLKTWLESRQSSVKMRIRRSDGGQDVELDASNVNEIMPILERIFKLDKGMK